MPEITLKDEFGQNISRVIRENNYAHILEIGSWDGLGSTRCIIDGMRDVASEDKILQCVEINPDRYAELVHNTLDTHYVKTYNMSSISREHFLPTCFDDVWNSPHNKLPEGELKFPRDMVEGWYNEDVSRLSDTGFLESKHLLREYDAVLIDGSEFTGLSEFHILESRSRVSCYMLDDVFWAYKCNGIFQFLLLDTAWELLYSSDKVRNGYAIFRRR